MINRFITRLIKYLVTKYSNYIKQFIISVPSWNMLLDDSNEGVNYNYSAQTNKFSIRHSCFYLSLTEFSVRPTVGRCEEGIRVLGAAGLLSTAAEGLFPGTDSDLTPDCHINGLRVTGRHVHCHSLQTKLCTRILRMSNHRDVPLTTRLTQYRVDGRQFPP